MTPAPKGSGRTPDGVAASMSALGAAIWAMGLFVLVHSFVALTEAVRPGASFDVVNLTACDVLATSLVLLGIARLYEPRGSLRRAFGVRGIGPGHLVLSAVAGVALNPVLSCVDEQVLRRWPYDDPAVSDAMDKLVSQASPAVLLVSSLVVLPIACELVFRGALFTQLARAVPVDAVVMWTAMFFACSLEWRSMPGGLLLGLALGWMRAESGTVVAPVVARLALAAAQLVPVVRGGPDPTVAAAPLTWIIGSAVVGAAALAAMRGGRRGPRAPSSDVPDAQP
jgi:membrane protease YdiL (CAAX protease family)